MSSHNKFFGTWRQLQGKAQQDQLPLCPIATEFSRKIKDMIFTPLGASPSRGQVAQAKYLLQEEYQAWKKSIPALHLRNAAGLHRCIEQVYDASYDRLHLMDLTLRPPINLILDYHELTKQLPPAELPPPSIPQIAGIFIGTKD